MAFIEAILSISFLVFFSLLLVCGGCVWVFVCVFVFLGFEGFWGVDKDTVYVDVVACWWFVF